VISDSIPRTSKAAVLTRFGEPLELRELPIPRTLEPRAILVKIEVSSICGTDVHLWDGSMATTLPVALPVVPGHEMVGRVVALGEGAERDSVGQQLSVGDRIVYTHASCGRCHYCVVSRQPSLCKERQYYMFTTCEQAPYLLGGFSEYCYVFPNSGRVRVPDEVETDWASAASCALRSVITSFERLGPIEPWETVVIQGAGPLGLFATALARSAGAGHVVTIGAPAGRLDLARKWGAHSVISLEELPDAADRAERVRELTGGTGAEIVMEFSGAPPAFSEGLDLIRDGGRYVVTGQVGPHRVDISPTAITRRQLTILGSWSGEVSQYWKALQFLDEARSRIDFSEMITSRFPLEGASEALLRMQAGEEIKPVIVPGGS
jgi:L-iditol 2-dehydrogenase